MKPSNAYFISLFLALFFVTVMRQGLAVADTKFTLRPYLLLGQMKGDLSTEGQEADFNLGWGNTLQKGNGVLGLDFDIRNEDYNILSQVWYTALSDTETSVKGLSYDAAQQDFSALFITETLGLSVFKEGNNWFDITAGARFASVDNQLKLRAAGGETDYSQSSSWVDPVVGFSAQFESDEDLSFSFGGDYGGFNVGSSQTWQGMAVANFRLTSKGSFALGYRAMMHDYEKDDFTYSMVVHGPTVGFSFNF